MTLNEYQEKAMTTCLDSSRNPLYMLFMLGEEIGELQGKFSKAIRKGWISFEHNQIVVNKEKVSDDEIMQWLELVEKEMGDVFWGLAGLCDVLNWTLEDVAYINLDKLAARKAIGTIDGNGDGVVRGK